MATPKIPQNNNLTMSFNSTFSFIKKYSYKKKSRLPPITLNKINPEGPI